MFRTEPNLPRSARNMLLTCLLAAACTACGSVSEINAAMDYAMMDRAQKTCDRHGLHPGSHAYDRCVRREYKGERHDARAYEDEHHHHHR